MSLSGPDTTPLLTSFAHRRSCYTLTNTSTIPSSQKSLISLVHDCLNEVPSPFNSQTTRMTLLLGSAHSKLWSDIVASALMNKIGKERYDGGGTGKKIEGFAEAYGTVLFWDDPHAVEGLKGMGAGGKVGASFSLCIHSD